MEDYPSLAEGNGLENRQVGATRRGSSNLPSSLIKQRRLSDEAFFDAQIYQL